jgi:hypothetical protein
VALAVSAAAQPEVVGPAGAGSWCREFQGGWLAVITIPFFLRMTFDMPPPHWNHAPAAVFVALGAVIGIVALLLYFATGGLSRYGPFGGFGRF